jgi:acetyl-CoA carboxylase/biotin carboxylase 1
LGQMPSYEERLIQMEAVLKTSVTNNYYGEQGQGPRYARMQCRIPPLGLITTIRTPSAEVLKELSDSRYTVYDVLPAFFNHEDPMVTLGLSTSVFLACIQI